MNVDRAVKPLLLWSGLCFDKAGRSRAVEKVQSFGPIRTIAALMSTFPAGGILKTLPNRDAAAKFLEYLASDTAQAFFADAQQRWPTVKAEAGNPQLETFGRFYDRCLAIGRFGKTQVGAPRLADQVGWK